MESQYAIVNFIFEYRSEVYGSINKNTNTNYNNTVTTKDLFINTVVN